MFVPASTYRLQLHSNFNFGHLRGILDYLHELGVDTIYAAPVLRAVPGSMHGYDVVDPHIINPEIGTLEEMRVLAAELRRRNMRWIQDIVPNHMAFSTENARLMDVLERGKHSPYYDFFDIDWNHPDQDLNGKVMVPFLGKELDQCIADVEITVGLSDDGITVNYFDNRYPVSAKTVAFIAAELKDAEARKLVESLAEKMSSPSSLQSWHAAKKYLNIQIRSYRDEINAVLSRLSADPRKLQDVLSLQWYRLAYWKKTEHTINFRRFFTVNSLICLRMELPSVFDEYHAFIASLYQEGIIHGVRIDHIDGLNDPSGYLKRLRDLLGKDCYIIAEKILEAKEEMPGYWPLEGTSGYEFLSYVNQVFTDRKGSARLVKAYHEMLPGMPSYDEVVLLNKRLILNSHMAGELDNLVRMLLDQGFDGGFTREVMRSALSAFMLSLPVYRIYPDRLPLTDTSKQLINDAFHGARRLSPDATPALSFLESLFLGENGGGRQHDVVAVLRRLMQFTGPLTAKGVEDTTFYIYNPLISHVEVGDSPSTLGISIREFHERMIRRWQTTPLSLNATATHDTKRGEDARVRLNAISEMPDLWIAKVSEWRRLNAPLRRVRDGREAPVLNDEYFIYQSILGGFPEDRRPNETWIERLREYMVKVVREAKIMSDWADPNEWYENACGEFIFDILREESPFLESFQPFLSEVLAIANRYSVAQVVIKMTCPGIPDVYQGCELLDLSYVDPDNRRPVDYSLRQNHLTELERADDWNHLESYLSKHEDAGVGKLFVTWKCFALRRQYPALFEIGNYVPITVTGEGNVALVYARYTGSNWCLVVIPLGLSGKNAGRDGDFSRIFISLPANSPTVWKNIFTGTSVVADGRLIAVGELVKSFPVAVLVSGPTEVTS